MQPSSYHRHAARPFKPDPTTGGRHRPRDGPARCPPGLVLAVPGVAGNFGGGEGTVFRPSRGSSSLPSAVHGTQSPGGESGGSAASTPSGGGGGGSAQPGTGRAGWGYPRLPAPQPPQSAASRGRAAPGTRTAPAPGGEKRPPGVREPAPRHPREARRLGQRGGERRRRRTCAQAEAAPSAAGRASGQGAAPAPPRGSGESPQLRVPPCFSPPRNPPADSTDTDTDTGVRRREPPSCPAPGPPPRAPPRPAPPRRWGRGGAHVGPGAAPRCTAGRRCPSPRCDDPRRAGLGRAGPGRAGSGTRWVCGHRQEAGVRRGSLESSGEGSVFSVKGLGSIRECLESARNGLGVRLEGSEPASPQGGDEAPRALLTALGQERAGVPSVPGNEGPSCRERKGCGCGVASGGQRIEGEALLTPLRGAGAGGNNTSSGQRGATAWHPPRDGCWAWHKADPGNEGSKARGPIVVVSLSRASVYFNEILFSVKFVT
ncbi:proline-rich protein 2-like [Motacilla alba alba]|uniref:proline-rich protein 2-like n=1 Tax=Motacilla alba alba TaxID=1094192 RepID=UPI0018D54504|nr:proline-rich protein 2-like [Motacilla alba alba]